MASRRSLQILAPYCAPMGSPASTTVHRDATNADVPDVVALVESAYRGDSSRIGWTTEADLLDGQRTDADAVAEILADPESRLLLAVGPDGAIVGCCHVQRTDAVTSYFGSFAVRPGLQAPGQAVRCYGRASAARSTGDLGRWR